MAQYRDLKPLTVYLPQDVLDGLAERANRTGQAKAAEARRILTGVVRGTVADALDVLGLALVDHGHTWTSEERQAYERAIAAVK